jgi:hypothetical protein
MSASLFLIPLALAQPQPEKAVTAADKKAFFKLLATLPTRGEFFAEEGIAKAVPYTRVLLSLTEDDLKGRDIYPFLALGAGLMAHKEAREVGLKSFDQITYPMLKLSWAAMLIRQPDPPRQVVTFLKKALDSPEDGKTLAMMMGPGFPAFKKSVKDAFEKGVGTAVELLKIHRIKPLPEFSSGFGYEFTTLVLSPNGSFHAVRRLDNSGELITHDLQTGTRKVRPVPQPPGVKVEKFGGTFGDPLIAINARGDLLCRWMILGNGDHGLGILKAGAGEFVVKRIKRSLYHMVIVDDQEGGWLLVVGGPQFTVYRVEVDLSLTALGSFEGEGHHSTNVLAACMIGPNVLHCFWGDVVEGNHLRMRCVDFDVQRKTWLHDRVIQQIDEFVSSANRPKVMQLADKTLHYVWRVDTGQEKTKSAGTYYHSEAHGKTSKISDGYQFGAVPCGNRLVVCTTVEAAPNKVFFRVIHNGTIHTPTEITIAQDRKHDLGLEYMALATDADRIWFMNTLASDAIYELRLSDRNEKK